MRVSKWMFAALLGIFMFAGNFAMAQGHGNGKGHNKHGEDDDQGEHFYKDRDRDALRGWYDDHQRNLPPGLAKRDQLPPGLEKQLARRGTLPPGLQKRLQPIPEDLERRLPPPPPDCAHVLVGGHIVLLNRRTNIVVDVFHFEAR
jgi:Ni/Co efflux regulator RcnB